MMTSVVMSLVRQIVPSAAVGMIAEFALARPTWGLIDDTSGSADVAGERPHPSVPIGQDTGEIDGDGHGSVGCRAPVAFDVDPQHLAGPQRLTEPRVEEAPRIHRIEPLRGSGAT